MIPAYDPSQFEMKTKPGADPTLTCVDGSDALKIAGSDESADVIRAHLGIELRLAG